MTPAAQQQVLEALRLKFEAYFLSSRKSKGAGRAPNLARLPDGTYADDHTQRHWWTYQQALPHILAALAAAQPVKAEPVAWKCSNCGDVDRDQGTHEGDNWCSVCGYCNVMQPLYASPQPAKAVAPLTDDLVADIARECVKAGKPVEWAIRKAERAVWEANGLEAP